MGLKEELDKAGIEANLDNPEDVANAMESLVKRTPNAECRQAIVDETIQIATVGAMYLKEKVNGILPDSEQIEV